MTTEQRLDRIERLMETFAANQVTLQATVQRNSAAIEKNSAAIEKNSAAIENLTTEVAKTNKELEESVADLVGMITHFVEEGERERTSFQEEIKRIWEYLFQQHSGNGKGAT